MITYADIQRVNAEIKTTPIKGKEYAEVNQRITAFRKIYPTGFITPEIVRLDDDFKTGICVMRATVGYYDNGDKIILASGTAYEKSDSSYINKTSYIENCETSAVGRALGNAGFGIDTSVASYEEVQNAINNQEQPEKQEKAEPEPYKPAYDAKGAIKAFCNAHKIPMKDFVAYYDACVEMRLVPRISSDSMTKEQCDALLNAVEKNFAVPAEDAAV